jgi:hypothetical protein
MEDSRRVDQKDLFLILTNQIPERTWDLNRWIPHLTPKATTVADVGAQWQRQAYTQVY